MAPPTLAFLSGQQGITGSTQSGFADPGAQMVADLLARLETPAPEPPPKLGVGRRLLGGLGDALTAWAAVRAGGAPPAIGSFAQTIRARQAQFEAERADREAENRRLKRDITMIHARHELDRIRTREAEALRREREEADAKADLEEAQRQMREGLANVAAEKGIMNTEGMSIDQIRNAIATKALQGTPEDELSAADINAAIRLGSIGGDPSTLSNPEMRAIAETAAEASQTEDEDMFGAKARASFLLKMIPQILDNAERNFEEIDEEEAKRRALSRWQAIKEAVAGQVEPSPDEAFSIGPDG